LPQAEVWSVFRLYLSRTIEAMGFRVDAFVLMANHYHLIAWTTDQAVDQVMGWLLKRVSDEINRRSGRIKHVAYTAIDARNMSTAWPPVR
jgi:REP element-mobilizing transposase RayT